MGLAAKVCANGNVNCLFVSTTKVFSGDDDAVTSAANTSRGVMVTEEGRPAVAMLMPLQGRGDVSENVECWYGSVCSVIVHVIRFHLPLTVDTLAHRGEERSGCGVAGASQSSSRRLGTHNTFRCSAECDIRDSEGTQNKNLNAEECHVIEGVAGAGGTQLHRRHLADDRA